MKLTKVDKSKMQERNKLQEAERAERKELVR